LEQYDKILLETQERRPYLRYYQLVREKSKMNFNLRYQLVKEGQENGISEASRKFGTTRKTVRKWVRRYEEKGFAGLEEESRAPKTIPHKMKAEDEARVEEVRLQLKCKWGARKLKDRFKLNGGLSAIHRVIKQKGLMKPKRKKHRKRKDLSALKKKLGLCKRNQVDTKDLSDILNYWPYMKQLSLPRYEYTYRELSTGCCFYSYADENNSLYASIFARYVAEHLKRYGIKVNEIEWQSDNGSEFIGSVRKKTNRLSTFEKVLHEYGIYHRRIPPRASYLQGDVETFHRIVEDEFYDIESFDRGEPEFLGKAYAYQLYFNYMRNNRYRENKSPLAILKERFPETNQGILNLPPVRLEGLYNFWYNNALPGYHVPKPAHIIK
jgi:transposase-like protein